MMIVLLIMSIVLACLAPAMTTKMKADQSIQTSPWKWARNNVDAYFSAGSNQAAMIGQNEKADGDSAKLIINNSTGLDNLILFKSGNNILGRLNILNNNGMLFGTLRNGTVLGTSATSLGRNNTASGNYSSVLGASNTVTGNYSTSAGYNNTVSGNYSTAIGYYNKVEGNSSVAIGYWTKAPHKNSVAIGYGTASGEYEDSANQGWSTAVGYNTTATGYASVAYGAEAKALSDRSVALGSTSKVEEDADMAFGSFSYASGKGAIAIGKEACTKGVGSLALSADNCERDWWTNDGANAYNKNFFKTHDYATGLNGGAYSLGGISIGPWTMVYGEYGIGIGSVNKELFTSEPAVHTSVGPGSHRSIAIGHDSQVGNDATDAVSIGYSVRAYGANNIAIGKNACKNVWGSNKVCIGADSGPGVGSGEANGDDEVIYIGSKPKDPWPLYFTDWGRRNAVLEIWNTAPSKKYSEQHSGRRRGYQVDDGPTVYVNGNLVVRGYIGGLIADDKGDEYDEWGILSSNKPTGDNNAVKWGYVSDRRLKYVGKENNDGLAKLRQLKVFNYTFKKDEAKTLHVGVMAQDLQKIFPNAVKKGADGFLTIRMEDMFYAVINAIKELDAKYQAQQKRIDELEKRIKALEAKIK